MALGQCLSERNMIEGQTWLWAMTTHNSVVGLHCCHHGMKPMSHLSLVEEVAQDLCRGLFL